MLMIKLFINYICEKLSLHTVALQECSSRVCIEKRLNVGNPIGTSSSTHQHPGLGIDGSERNHLKPHDNWSNLSLVVEPQKNLSALGENPFQNGGPNREADFRLNFL